MKNNHSAFVFFSFRARREIEEEEEEAEEAETRAKQSNTQQKREKKEENRRWQIFNTMFQYISFWSQLYLLYRYQSNWDYSIEMSEENIERLQDHMDHQTMGYDHRSIPMDVDDIFDVYER